MTDTERLEWYAAHADWDTSVRRDVARIVWFDAELDERHTDVPMVSLALQVDLCQTFRDIVDAAVQLDTVTECCDHPEDRMYRAVDRTWWRRDGTRWLRADPPPGWQREQEAT